MKIIFVGIHNKPGKAPLDSSTLTGKVIDEFILVMGGKCIKSNLYDQETFPTINRRNIGAQMGHIADWQKRVNYQPEDLIVCLGELVAGIFRYWKKAEATHDAKIMHIPHPAAQRSNTDQRNYISQSIIKISTYGN